MTSISRYWRLVQIDNAGQRRSNDVVVAKAFWENYCINWLSQIDEVNDLIIQQRLIQIWRSADQEISPEQQQGAALCLRCFISHQIEKTCLHLADKYGSQHGFSGNDLLYLVLTDVAPRASRRSLGSPSFAQQILQSFDPTKAGLSTWVVRQVKRHPEISLFLKAHGVILMTDWSILNRTSVSNLQQILARCQWNLAEIDSAAQLLASYHQIYRGDRLQQRQTGHLSNGQACPEPTLEQLTRMATALSPHTGRQLSPAQVLQRLGNLASQLRQDQVARQGSFRQMQSLDTPEVMAVAEKQQALDRDLADDVQIDFLMAYRREFRQCLDQALAEVTRDRLNYIQRRKPHDDSRYLRAMYWFHCRGQTMAAIARQLELQQQYQVTRLLNLKEFRADVRRHLLGFLSDRVPQLATRYLDTNQLQDLDRRIQQSLDAEVERVIYDAAAEAATPKHQPPSSLFSQRLCQHLDTYPTLQEVES